MNLQENWERPKLNGPYEDGTTPKHPYCRASFQIHDTSVSVMLGYGTTSLLDGFPTFQDSAISKFHEKLSFIPQGFLQMSVTFHPLRWLHIRRERRQHLHRCERLKSTAVRLFVCSKPFCHITLKKHTRPRNKQQNISLWSLPLMVKPINNATSSY
jgi:hypothetical protein